MVVSVLHRRLPLRAKVPSFRLSVRTRYETSLKRVKMSSQSIPSMSGLGKSGDKITDGIAPLLC